MYIAELKGKIPSILEEREDLLTSNVFSFFKYSNRSIFLKSFLEKLNIKVTKADLQSAEFIFWPNFDDKTQPDLVIIIGKYYLLFEAKYHSDFRESQQDKKLQLVREIDGGLNEAKSLGKDFILIAVTSDYYYPEKKFQHIPLEFQSSIRWTNWQAVSSILLNLIEEYDTNLPNYLFAKDLYDLLDQKKLRIFCSFKRLMYITIKQSRHYLFFNYNEASYRGAFVGFINALKTLQDIKLNKNNIFFNSNFFQIETTKIANNNGSLFFKRED